MGFLRNLWNKLTRLFTWLGNLFVKILVVALIVAAIYLAFIGAWPLAIMLLVAAFLVDPDMASAIAEDIGNAAGDVAEALADVSGDVTAGFLSGIFGSELGTMIVTGATVVGGIWLLSKVLSPSKDVQRIPSSSRPTAVAVPDGSSSTVVSDMSGGL